MLYFKHALIMQNSYIMTFHQTVRKYGKFVKVLPFTSMFHKYIFNHIYNASYYLNTSNLQ